MQPVTLGLEELLLLAAVFAFGGLVKGTTGMGLIMISLPVLTFFFPVQKAVAFALLPVLFSNVVLLAFNRNTVPVAARHWSLLLPMALVLAVTSQWLVTLGQGALRVGIGSLALGYVLLEVVDRRPAFLSSRHWALAPAVGVVGGVLGGLTSFFGLPIMLYFASQHLGRDHFVTAATLMYLTGSVVLSLVFARYQVLGSREVLASIWCLPSMVVGLYLGTRLRERLNARRFRAAVLTMIGLTGLTMIGRSLAGV